MRCFFAFTVVAASLCVANVLRADDGLFSEVAMESVFTKPVDRSEKVASKRASNELDWSNLGADTEVDRITGMSLLLEVLRAADFDPKQKDGRAKIQLMHAGWKFPVSLEVQVEKDRIVCKMSLIRVDNAQVGTATLLDLLSLGDTVQGTYFAYDRGTKMLQVRRSLANRVITAGELKSDLRAMASLAVTHADVWTKLKPAASKSSKTSTSAPKKREFSTLGRWSASVSRNESLAIALTSDSRFQLVHLKAGKSTVSKGKATRRGDRLTLVGDGSVTLNCRVSQTSSDRFQLAILDSKGQAAATFDFKKAR